MTNDKNEDTEGRFFVLSIDSDPHAIPAMKAYIKSCVAENPTLAMELSRRVAAVQEEGGVAPPPMAYEVRRISGEIREKRAAIERKRMIGAIVASAQEGRTFVLFEPLHGEGSRLALARLEEEDGFRVEHHTPQPGRVYAASIHWD